MNSKDIKFDFDDIVIEPAIISDIESRTEIRLDKTNLPLFVAPMDTVVDKDNLKQFLDLGYNVAFPRNEEINPGDEDSVFISVGLTEAETMLTTGNFPKKLLIDVANGHMKRLYNIAKSIKSKYPDVILMVGNIANPLTYKEYAEIGVDYIRAGIGSGSSCTTSANVAVHYPMASLISECYQIKADNNYTTKIVADGGFKKFEDIIKALALGADYVMLGSLLSKTLESCSGNYRYDKSTNTYTEISKESASLCLEDNIPVYKSYRGMSTKEVQKKWNTGRLKTAEGISFYNRVEYKLPKWTENFMDYLRSCMSYTGKRELYHFKGKVRYNFITSAVYKRYSK